MTTRIISVLVTVLLVLTLAGSVSAVQLFTSFIFRPTSTGNQQVICILTNVTNKAIDVEIEALDVFGEALDSLGGTVPAFTSFILTVVTAGARCRFEVKASKNSVRANATLASFGEVLAVVPAQ
jgi:hypothetical protein